MRNVPEDIIKWRASLLKLSVSLANVTAKASFLGRCSMLGILPKGFKLKFSLQSGLPKDVSEEFDAQVERNLLKVSFENLRTAREADVRKISILYSQLKDVFGKFEEQEQYVELSALKFRKILDIRIKIHYNKLKKLLKDFPERFIDVEEEVFLFSSTLYNWCQMFITI